MMRKLLLSLAMIVLYGTVSYSQTRRVGGTVTDNLGEPLVGVSVMLKGSNQGKSTGENGAFSLDLPAQGESVLRIDFLGYKSQEVYVDDVTQALEVVLEADDAAMLDEVVAVGYGTIRKGDLTGSVGSVSADALVARGTTSAMGALQGAVAGVDISSNSVRPGGGFNIRIRGQNSLAGGNPLYVVDGVVTSDINFLNPADIEQIDVLKDASSTAIYGSRGSNGVVIVKTKNAGTPGSPRTTITYDGFYGIRELARIPDFMDGREWVDFRTSAFYEFQEGNYVMPNRDVILHESPLLELRLYEEKYEDWLKLGTRYGQQQNH